MCMGEQNLVDSYNSLVLALCWWPCYNYSPFETALLLTHPCSIEL